MTTYAQYTGLVTNEDGTQVSLREGEIWPDGDQTVKEHPDKFTSTEPNSEVAGAFPLEHTLRSTDSLDGDAVEEKRMEGEHPRGYAVPGEDPETGEKTDAALDEGKSARGAGLRTDSVPGAKVERATRAPGETRGARTRKAD